MQRIVVLPGDGIGPEVTHQARRVLEASASRHGLEIDFEEALIGGASIDAHGSPLTDEVVALCRDSRALLLGAVGGPKWDDPAAKVRPEQGLLKIRKVLGLFANLRPVSVEPSLKEASPLRADLIEGVDINELSDNRKSEYRAKRMGFVFQFYNLLPVLSTVENVELPLLVGGVGARDARRRAQEALDRVHLADWASHRPAELSGGQRQRVTVARSLVNNPAIVWADEPTGDLDSTNANEIMDLMVELNESQNQTFVIVTHAREIADRCHRLILMRDGLIVDEQAIAAAS